MVAAQRTARRSGPWHLWLIGILGLLWNVMGVVSFVLTQMNVAAVMNQFPPQQREYFLSFPPWAVTCWAVGVFGGLIGCVLLLVRHRLAFPALLASLIGIAVTNIGGLFLLGGMQVMRETDALGITLLPVFISAFLACYAGVLSSRSNHIER